MPPPSRRFLPRKGFAGEPLSQARQTSRSRWRYSSSETLQRLKCHVERHRDQLKEDLGAWKRRMRSLTPERGWSEPGASHSPELLSVHPRLVRDGFSNKRPHVEYTAELRLNKGDHRHTWETDPFSLDQLLAIVVSTRYTNAKRWCSLRSASGNTEPPSSWWAIGQFLHNTCSSFLAWALRHVAFWVVILLIARSVHARLHLCVRGLRVHTLGHEPDSTEPEDGLSPDWFAAAAATLLFMSFTAGLLAGVTEMSFIPAKVILHLERKDETEQVREQLALLLSGKGCLDNLDICDFLGLGMSTYYNSSETMKEGRCFYRRHESTDGYFAHVRRNRWNFGPVTLDCRRRGPLGTEAGLTEAWLVLRKDGFALFRSIVDQDPADMLFFDPSFSLFRNDDDRILVCGATFLLELAFAGHAARQHDRVQNWCNAITLTAQLSTRTKAQRFGSFAPIRNHAAPKPGDRHMLRGSLARYLINGQSTFRKIGEAILLARHEIFILGFWISPHLPLVREGEALPGNADPHLSSLLLDAARRGVRVCVLLYYEWARMMPNDSEWCELELNKLKHPNILVVRHRSRFDSNRLWTHHEKVVVIDQQLAFVGGLDLCHGRYDNAEHRLDDAGASPTWEGPDYHNPRIRDFTGAEARASTDSISRKSQPRMPWQDISCMLVGVIARDVARHCIERWNYAKAQQPQYSGFPTALLRRKAAVGNDALMALLAEGPDPCWPPECGGWQECTAQVVRSVARWSAGTRTETSVHAAFCDLIEHAERFVYIENQFFVSGMDGDEMVGNRIVEAIFRRVLRAYEKAEAFHVMLVLPLLPAFDGMLTQNASSPLQCVMYWQYRTLRALRQRLQQAGIDMQQYVSVYGLRTHGHLESGAVTEQVYVHSKLMIVDDHLTLLGSANVNDRSLLGIRDSELNVVLDSRGSAEGGFSVELRRALFAQHLGWTRGRDEGLPADPLGLMDEVRRVAQQNTQIYEDAFGALPSDSVRSWSELAGRQAEAGQLAGDFTKLPGPEHATQLSQVQGYLVEFPLDFLVEEDLAPPKFSVGALTPDCFT